MLIVGDGLGELMSVDDAPAPNREGVRSLETHTSVIIPTLHVVRMNECTFHSPAFALT